MIVTLDDFLFALASQNKCHHLMNCFLKICENIGIPIAHNKTLGPAQVLTFLGIEIDCINQKVLLPEEKLNKCRQEIKQLLHSK